MWNFFSNFVENNFHFCLHKLHFPQNSWKINFSINSMKNNFPQIPWKTQFSTNSMGNIIFCGQVDFCFLFVEKSKFPWNPCQFSLYCYENYIFHKYSIVELSFLEVDEFTLSLAFVSQIPWKIWFSTNSMENNFLEKWIPTFHLQFVEYVLRTYFVENPIFHKICGKLCFHRICGKSKFPWNLSQFLFK